MKIVQALKNLFWFFTICLAGLWLIVAGLSGQNPVAETILAVLVIGGMVVFGLIFVIKAGY